MAAGSHRLGRFEADADQAPSVVLLAKAGQPLLFDYRIRHRGLGNKSTTPRPCLYLTYAVASYDDRANFAGSRYKKLPGAVYASKLAFGTSGGRA
jgi:hypothetical protein